MRMAPVSHRLQLKVLLSYCPYVYLGKYTSTIGKDKQRKIEEGERSLHTA